MYPASSESPSILAGRIRRGLSSKDIRTQLENENNKFSLFEIMKPIHTDPFLFKNALFLIHFDLASILKQLKLD